MHATLQTALEFLRDREPTEAELTEIINCLKEIPDEDAAEFIENTFQHNNAAIIIVTLFSHEDIMERIIGVIEKRKK